VVAVGDSAKVELIFNTGKRRGGKVSKKATVTTNDNSRGNFQLALKGKIYTEHDSTHLITLSQGSIEFDPETIDNRVEIEVHNQSDEKLKMTLIDDPEAFLDIEVSGKDIKPGKERKIKVRIAEDCEVDHFKKSFTFELNDAEKTRYTIPIELKKVLAHQPAALHNAARPAKQVKKPSTEDGK
jgi:uncharacterized protein YqfB (UPF0267 family)